QVGLVGFYGAIRDDQRAQVKNAPTRISMVTKNFTASCQRQYSRAAAIIITVEDAATAVKSPIVRDFTVYKNGLAAVEKAATLSEIPIPPLTDRYADQCQDSP